MQEKVQRFLTDQNLRSSLKTRCVDPVSEIGELGKEILKESDYGKKDVFRAEALEKETGDCLFSLLAFCQTGGINAEKALDRALEKYGRRILQKGGPDSGR